MILTVDIGNSNIVLGLYDQNLLVDKYRLRTDLLKTSDEYSIIINELLKGKDITGVIISSVVPNLNRIFKVYFNKQYKIEPMFISQGIKTGMKINLDNPKEIGADLLCTAVGANNKYQSPIIVIDLGTATKITAVKDNCFLGGTIFPGIEISLAALSEKTALLPYIELVEPKNVIGRSTVDAMRSGLVVGTAAMIDGMVKRYKEELQEDATVIACGGLAQFIIPACRESIIYDEDILLDGLKIIYDKNK